MTNAPRDDRNAERDRPADGEAKRAEIKVTESMIRSGLAALAEFDSARDPSDEIVRDVYRAMEEARLEET